MKDALIVSALSVVPRNRGARAMGWMARSGLSRLAVKAFVAAYKADPLEAERPMAEYRTLEEFFTRRLKPGARPVDAEPDAVVSPVDGLAAWVGPSTGGRIEIAPGRYLSVADLLGEPVEGERDVVVLYLSPKDYHRVHVAREGQATAWRYVPGTLWPVFPAAVRKVDGLFARNERVVVRTETSAGRLDVVLVGAFGVGRITVTVTDLITNTGGLADEGQLNPPVALGRGEDLGVFHLGSTVVMVAQPGTFEWTVAKGETVRMGRTIGRTSK